MSISRKQTIINHSTLKGTNHLVGTQSTSQEFGFTIIEVMIVLVIAAAIILLVFLAVPPLQRNSRNNQRKSDAARVLSAAEEWRTNNANRVPNCNDMDENGLKDRQVGVIPQCDTREEIEQLAGNLGFYDHIWSINVVQFPGFMTSDNSLTEDQQIINFVGDSVLIRSKTSCAEPNKLKDGSGMVVVYSQETANGIVLACKG